MFSYTSQGGKPRSLAAQRGEGVKFVLGMLGLVILALVAYWAYTTYIDSKDSCVDKWPDMSLFTTGDPTVDQRIAWAIAHDDSDHMTASEALVTQLWDTKSTQFTGEAQELWDKAQDADLVDLQMPWLSITEDGVIVPFYATPEVHNAAWEWSTSPTQGVTSLLLATREGSSVTVPVITLEHGQAVPVLAGKEDVKIARQEVCVE